MRSGMKQAWGHRAKFGVALAAIVAVIIVVLAASMSILSATAEASSPQAGNQLVATTHPNAATASIPDCSNDLPASDKMCHVDYLLAQLGIGCGSYEQVKNTCLFSYLFSRARDTTPWFDADGVGGSKFYWEQDHYPGQQRTAILAVFSYTPFPQSDKYLRAAMGGISPGPGSSNFYVYDAYDRYTSTGTAQHWCTPKDSTEKKDSAGQVGGPMYLNYDPHSLGAATLYLYGYLIRADNPQTECVQPTPHTSKRD